MLRALAATWLTDRPHAGVAEPYERLLDVRDALHVGSGRPLDRLLAARGGRGLRAAGLRRAGRPAPGGQPGRPARRARRRPHRRAARQAVPQRRVLGFTRRERRPEYPRAEHGLIIHAGEVGFARQTGRAGPLAGLQAGALAATQGLMLSPVTAENLGARVRPLPDPWPEPAREALLSCCPPARAAAGVGGARPGRLHHLLVPERAGVRARPQHNPVHQHTVDRHSVQTVVEAHRHLTRVERPDLLLLALLLHDIGKVPGAGADHPAVGAPVARRVGGRLGLAAADVDLVELLVREHLTLAELATRRDHADPATRTRWSPR